MNHGFSLLEVLAATVVLGLLAVAVVPLTGRLVGDDGRIHARLAAGEHLRRIDPAAVARLAVATPMAEHPGWWIRAERLGATSPPPVADQAEVRPAHGWLRVVVVDGPGPEAQVLAQRLVLVAGGGP